MNLTSPESEQCSIGCILLDPSKGLEALIGVPVDVYHDIRHREIVTALLAMEKSGKPIDTITLIGYLRENGTLEQCGGVVYLASLADGVPSALNAGYYVSNLMELYQKRRISELCNQTINSLKSDPASVSVEGFEAQSMQVRVRGAKEDRTMKDILRSVVDKIQEASKIGSFGIQTGYQSLDTIMQGMRGGELYVFGARPGTGKTAFLGSLATNLMGFYGGEEHPGIIFSLEMSDTQLAMRMAQQEAQVNLGDIGTIRAMTELQKKNLTLAMARLAKCSLTIDDTPGVTVDYVRAVTRKAVKEKGVKWVGIDYLQILRSMNPRQSREEQIGTISNELKNMAKELGVPVITLAQLNREVEGRGKNGIPKMSDLRDSGRVEQDAAMVCMLYPIDDHYVGMNVCKNRFGRSDVILKWRFNKPNQRFESAERLIT